MAAEKTTYILTWNPSKWNWEDYDAAVEKTGQGESHVIPWSTGSTKGIRKDDRLFMLRQNVDRGLIAAGYAASDCFQDSHWDGSGRNANFVRFEIDCLLPIEKRLPIENLLDETAFTWNNMPASGMSLPPEDAEIVEHLWLDHLASHQSKTIDSKPRNPAWQRDELILALDLYFRHPPKTVSQTHSAVVALSELLNALPIHANRPDGDKFRNPNGVYMKLGNFLRFDPDYEGAGLSRGGKLEEAIWNEFASDRERLQQLAVAIADGYSSVSNDIQLEDEDESEFPEGRVLYRLHRQRERNTNLVKKKKATAESLSCEVCGFDFLATYGEIGRGYIECHHTLPISDYSSGQKTKLQDLVLVCANCHRMLHRRRPWLSISELAGLVSVVDS